VWVRVPPRAPKLTLLELTAVERDDAQETIEKLTTLEKQRDQLGSILKNIFGYLKDTNDKNE
jgi:hypothetical protein